MKKMLTIEYFHYEAHTFGDFFLKITIKYINDHDVVDENGPWDQTNAIVDYSLENVKRQIAIDTSLRLRSGFTRSH